MESPALRHNRVDKVKFSQTIIMRDLIQNLPYLLATLAWVLLWATGGYWMVRSAFNLRSNELGLIGFSVGLVTQTWLTNLLARWIPFTTTIWLTAVIVLITGLIFALPEGWRNLFRFKISPWQWIIFAILAYSFTAMARGLAIFDDYAHLPTTSILATGDIPPHFPLNPSASYGYHYFLMLFAAQVMRLANLPAWVALDAARGLSFGLSMLMIFIWVERITWSKVAGFVGAAFAAFAGGTRWLLLLLPSGILAKVSSQVTMLGSAAQSSPDLAKGLISPWIMEGAGPFLFPLAYGNGISSPSILGHGPNGLIGGALATPLLMTFNRWKNWRALVITVIIMAAGSLLSETGLLLSLAAWGLLTLYEMIRQRKFSIPPTLRKWWLVIILSFIISVLQGGTWTDVIAGFINRLAGSPAAESYQTMGFALVWPPTIVSANLGVLSLTNPWQMLAAAAEIGPMIIMLPLVAIYGLKAARNRRWYEAAGILGAFITLPLMFVQYTGSAGVRNTSRLYDFIGIAGAWAVPVGWMWLKRRSETLKAAAVVLSLVLIMGGVVLFGISLIAAQRPVASSFIGQLDEPFQEKYWNKLDRGMMLFDHNPYRGVTLFGLFTNAGQTWLIQKPQWEALYEAPDPYALRAEGYGYYYSDELSWYDLNTTEKASFSEPCVRLVEEVKHKRLNQWRRLYDIRECVK